MANRILSKQQLKALFADGQKPIGDNYDDWITTMAKKEISG